MNNDFSSQIAAFKSAGAEIVTGVMIPPDFATFWSQAAQQGFKPKIVTIGKALLFPSAINSLGARGNGLTTEIWWSPNHPFKSGLTGQSCKQLADAYVAATKRPWSQPIGFQHALFEVAIDVLKRAKAIEPKAILDSIVATNYQSIVGPVQWTGKPVKNVTKTPLVAGQWQKHRRQVRAGHHREPPGSEHPDRRQDGTAELGAPQRTVIARQRVRAKRGRCKLRRDPVARQRMAFRA